MLLCVTSITLPVYALTLNIGKSRYQIPAHLTSPAAITTSGRRDMSRCASWRVPEYYRYR
jgi:hypothetical protein